MPRLRQIATCHTGRGWRTHFTYKAVSNVDNETVAFRGGGEGGSTLNLQDAKAANRSSVDPIPLPSMPLRISLNGERPSSATSNSIEWYYDNPLLIVSSVLPNEGPAAGGTPVTIRGSSLVNIGTPYCKFGSLPPVQGILLNESATAPGEVLSGSHPSSGERISGVVCASPSHLVLRESIESRDCYTRDWHRFEETCGTQETMPLELSLTGVREALSGGRSGGFTSSHVPFTYHAFLTNPEDVILRHRHHRRHHRLQHHRHHHRHRPALSTAINALPASPAASASCPSIRTSAQHTRQRPSFSEDATIIYALISCVRVMASARQTRSSTRARAVGMCTGASLVHRIIHGGGTRRVFK